MNNIKWTKSQKKAIKTRGSSIIVSAAAGSGKTEILSQRIIEMIQNNHNVDRFLVVTFTNAAAEQMKRRISQKLDNLVLKNPKSKHFKKQQTLILRANIQTVHGFCKNLIKENFNFLDVSQNFKIADNSEVLILKKKAINLTLEEFYKESSEDFINLVNSVSSQKDDLLLVDLIEKLHEFLNSLPFPKEWMNSTLKKIKEGDCIWQNIIIKHLKERISGYENILKNLIESIRSKEKIFNIYSKFLLEELEIFKKIEKGFEKNDFFLCKVILESIVFSRLPSSKNCDDEILKNRIFYFHKKIKEEFKKLLENFSYNKEDILFLNKKTYNLSKSLFCVLKEFKKNFYQLKKEKNILDFSDLEHLTLKLLIDENKEKTVLAKETSLNFEEILIDEYQDTNEIQEIIFKTISKDEKNLFMVGDVKQSVYSFRRAKPKIFTKRRENSFYCEDFNIKLPSKISLSENFRSDKKILDFVNFLFSNIMTKDSCSIEYENQEQMKTFKEKKSLKNAGVEIFVLETSESNEEERAKNEAKFVAQTIKNLIESSYEINEKKVEYKDFCILFRSINSCAKIFKETLENNNIKTFINLKEDFFSLEEISMIVSLLEVINNESVDMAVVGALMSPLFNFDINKMSLIRLENKESNFYSCVKSYAKKDLKCERFLKKINELRLFSKNNSTSALINKIYIDFKIFSVIKTLENSENKTSNLRRFVYFAKNSECETLYEFLNFIDKIKRNNIPINSSSDSDFENNSVKIMSIHGSKGLEFPICILANCSFSFHNEKDDTLFDEDLGIGMKILDIDSMKKYHTIQRDAISLKLKDISLAEEMRVLYVALTRACQKNIIIISTKNFEKTFQKLSLDTFKKPDIFAVKNAKNFSDWILMALMRHPSGQILREKLDFVNFSNENSDLKINFLKLNKNYFETEKEIKKDEGFVYDFSYELEKNVKEENLNEKLLEPKFLKKSNIFGSDIGNIYHKFMEFANFKEAKLNPKRYVLELIKKEILTSFEAKILDIKKIENFLNSKLCERIINSKDVLKEYEFMTKDSNGTIDLIFEENNELVVVDYKTSALKNPSEFIKIYENQLKIYQKAVDECFEKKLKEIFLYSFHLERTIKLETKTV